MLPEDLEIGVELHQPYIGGAMGAAYIKTVFLTNADTGIPAVGSGNYFVEPSV